MAEVLKLLRKVENGVESFYRGTVDFAKRHGLEIVEDVEDAAEAAEKVAEAVEVRLGADAKGKSGKE